MQFDSPGSAKKIFFFGPGVLPQAPFFCKKYVFGPGTLPQAPFFCEKNTFLVLECCRRRLFFWKKHVLGPGVLPQAPFFCEKTRFWSLNVAAGSFFLWTNRFLVLSPSSGQPSLEGWFNPRLSKGLLMVWSKLKLPPGLPRKASSRQ